MDNILESIRSAASRKILYLPHAVSQMSRLDRMITPAEVRGVIAGGEMIEDYPEDPRGHSCLLLGRGENARPIHVVCSAKEDYLAIITAYIPSSDEWQEDYKHRR